MAGYFGFSMSNNAVDAYRSGEKPISKWSKEAILSAIAEIREDSSIFEKLTKEELISAVMEQSSWHHTGKLYNRTDFYSVDEEKVSAITAADIEKIVSARTPKQAKEKEPSKMVKLEYGEWEGSRKHPKLKEYTDYAIVCGNVAYLPNGKTKRMSGTHIYVIETYTRAPKGTAETFRNIRKAMPESMRKKTMMNQDPKSLEEKLKAAAGKSRQAEQVKDDENGKTKTKTGNDYR